MTGYFIARLAALLPNACVALTCYHGVFAPKPQLHEQVTPVRCGRRQATGLDDPPCSDDMGATTSAGPPSGSAGGSHPLVLRISSRPFIRPIFRKINRDIHIFDLTRRSAVPKKADSRMPLFPAR